MNRALPIAVLALLAGCTIWSRSSIQEDYRQLLADMQSAQVDEYAEKCAPRELALAFSHQEFASIEFEQGDARRGAEHLELAQTNMALALQAAEACRPHDRDNDGVMDADDRCPDVPEDRDQFEDGDGCPEDDNDKDGIVDTADACPNDPEDKDTFQDTDGCPDPDNDNDKILDAADACPYDPEDYDGDRDTDGCPDLEAKDTDKDGIPDDRDACPNDPENFNEYLDTDGCPDEKPKNVKVTKDKIEISQKIYFETAKTIIKPVSYGILNEVAQVLKDYPNLTIRVEGHTDSDGKDDYNMTLSQGRSESVMTYLTGQGVAANRLTAQGFGESRPIDTNKTSEGKANNRRVEFMITGGL